MTGRSVPDRPIRKQCIGIQEVKSSNQIDFQRTSTTNRGSRVIQMDLAWLIVAFSGVGGVQEHTAAQHGGSRCGCAGKGPGTSLKASLHSPSLVFEALITAWNL